MNIRYQIVKRLLKRDGMIAKNKLAYYLARLIATTYPSGTVAREFGYFRRKDDSL